MILVCCAISFFVVGLLALDVSICARRHEPDYVWEDCIDFRVRLSDGEGHVVEWRQMAPNRKEAIRLAQENVPAIFEIVESAKPV
jgi:hypothetical protein